MPKIESRWMIADCARPAKPIADCDSLGDIRDSVAQMIEQYGENARYEFEAGANNIFEEIWYRREENDVEYAARLKADKAEVKRKALLKTSTEANERALLKKLRAKYGDEA